MPVGGTAGWQRIAATVRDGHPSAWTLLGTLVLCRPDLGVHGVRGALVSAALADPIGIHVDATCMWAFLLRDVGHLHIPERMLDHPGPLHADERRALADHPVVGAALVARVDTLADAAPIVLAHHERWDGDGYPRGAVGHDIPVPARVLAVGDAYAALTAGRPHRPAYSPDEAVEVVATYAGSQFDPQIAELLPDVVAELPDAILVPPAGDLPPSIDRRLSTHIDRASTLSPAQREALFAAGLGLEAREAARRLERATGTQRTWSASVRRTLACPPRVTMTRFLRTVGRELFRSLVPGSDGASELTA